MIRVIAASLIFASASTAGADEAAVRRLVQDKLRGGGAIESLRKLPNAELFEVAVRSADGILIYYIDPDASVIIAGKAFDAKSGRDLTDERMRVLTAIKWESLPFDWALTSARGSGRRKIAVFSDPNCPYCKIFEKNLAKLDDVTVHIFLYPVIKPESVTQTKSVWCSKDRVKAWNDLMLKDIQPRAAPDCDTPIEKLVDLGHKLGANSTPTWYLQDGSRHQGALALDDVRALLDAASPVKR
ncbi:MAG: DsbC family protein [Betaproteobacteria bacterium]